MMSRGQSVTEPDCLTLRQSGTAIPTQLQNGHFSLIKPLKMMKLGALKGMQIALSTWGGKYQGYKGETKTGGGGESCFEKLNCLMITQTQQHKET